MRRHPTMRYLTLLHRILDGAHAWYRSVYHPRMEWAVFRAQFLANYNSAAVRTGLLKQLYGKPQATNETAYKFIMDKWALFSQLAPNTKPADRLQTVQELLPPQTRAITRGTRFQSLPEMVKTVSQIQNDLREDRVRSVGPDRNPTTMERRPPIMNARQPPPQLQTGRPPSPCHYCRGDHYNRQCSTRQGNGPGAAAAQDARPHNPNTERIREEP